MFSIYFLMITIFGLYPTCFFKAIVLDLTSKNGLLDFLSLKILGHVIGDEKINIFTFVVIRVLL